MDIKVDEIDKLKELVKLREERPEEYKKFIDGAKAVMKDMFKMMIEVQMELEKVI